MGCKECAFTTDSFRSKQLCMEHGHCLVEVQAKKTRWECRSCKWSIFVIDRELPPHCHKCNASEWKQVSLTQIRTATMEKELLLPRGEELPFLNSLPTSAAFKQRIEAEKQEAEADYYSSMDLKW